MQYGKTLYVVVKTPRTLTEIAWTKIQLKGCKALYTGCFYRKPHNEPSALENLNNSLSRLTHNSTLPNVILTGDFNLPDIDWDEDAYKDKLFLACS
jgi:hypothetical protein